MTKKLYIIDTNTDMGKTYVTGLINKKLIEANIPVAYYKAAMSGTEDAQTVQEVSLTTQSTESMCPFVYHHPVSPHLAAKLEGNPVKLQSVLEGYQILTHDYELITLEGSGGIFCPLSDELWLIDVIKALEAPCLLVADAGLGTINQVGLTVHYLNQHHIKCQGIILNRFDTESIMHQDNLKTIEKLTGLKVITTLSTNQQDINLSVNDIKSLYI